jgi:hypothetical protein
MSLEDELKELQEQLKTAQEAENEPQQEEQQEEPAPAAPEPETVAPAEDDADETKDDEGDEPKSPSAYAKMRREAAQAKREAEEARREAEALRAQMAQPRSAEQPQPKVDAAPDPKEDYTGWLEHQISDLQRRIDQRDNADQANYLMNSSLSIIEADAERIRSDRPDLDDAREFAVKELKKSYRLAGIPSNQLDYHVNLRLIQEAAEGKKAGQNTASYLYDWAVSELGYNPKQDAPSEPPKARDLKPDMSKVAANRARNAGTMTPSGNGSGSNALDIETLSAMKPSELQKIPVEERNRIYREAGFQS